MKVDNDDGDGHGATDWWYSVVSAVAEIRLGCVKGVDDVKHDTDEAGIHVTVPSNWERQQRAAPLALVVVNGPPTQP